MNRSPTGELSTSVSSLCGLLTKLDNYSHLLICGDFNFKEITWSDFSGSTTNSHIVPFLDSVDDLFLLQHVDKPTRIRQGDSPSLLDLVLTNEENMNLMYLPPLGNSDHICIQFDLLRYLEPKKTDNLKYNTRAADIDLMKQTLGDVVSLLDPLDMNNAWLHFKSNFQDALDNCVPTYKPKEKKSLYSNSEVFSLKRKKNHFWKKYLSTHRPADLINFKSVNNQLRSLIRNLRKDYKKKLVQGVRSRPKAFWQYVNSRTKVRPGITEVVSTDGSAIQSDIDMATLFFNEYFSSVFNCEDTASIPTVDSTSSPPLDDSIEITPEIVFSKLTAIQSSKSPGPDGCPTTIIKSVSEFISVPLCILFNKSLNSGILLTDWKCANVTPIHKKGAHQ